MNALDYLATLPAYVINLDRARERWDRMQREVAPYVASLTRVTATDAAHLSTQEVTEFRAKADGLSEVYPTLGIPERKSYGYWRGSLAVYRSHLDAIRMGIEAGHLSFLILEDDCGVRPDLLRSTEVPPTFYTGGAAVWGGALVGGSYTSHARRARTSAPNVWQQIPQTPEGVRNRYLAHAYELDAATAPKWLAAVENNPQAYDTSWWFGMMAVRTYVPTTELLYQDLSLGSDRSAVVDANRKRAALKMSAEEML